MTDLANILRTSILAIACISVVPAQTWAEEDAEDTASLTTMTLPEEQQVLQPEGQIFMPLPRIVQIIGVCEVKLPHEETFRIATEGKAYPLGVTIRSGENSSVTLEFSAQEHAKLKGNTLVMLTGSRKDTRNILLHFGRVETELRDNLPEGSFGLSSFSVKCENMEGRGEYTMRFEEDNEIFRAHTITGTSRINSDHFHIPKLQAANAVEILNNSERTFYRTTSVLGDYVMVLNKGEEEPVHYALTPKAVVKIWRDNAEVGGRPIVSALVVNPQGKAQHRFVYAIGRPIVATGELVEAAQEETDLGDLPVLIPTIQPLTPPKVQAAEDVVDDDVFDFL